MKPQFTLLYRIWHWTMAFSVIGLLLTVLLRKTFLSWRDNSALIQSKLAETGTEITAETAKMIAKAIRAPMWEWHYILGLFLAISIVIRLYMIASGRAEMPLKTLMQAPKEEMPKHLVHLVLCFTIMLMTLSGGFYYFHEGLGFTKDGVHWVKEVHEYMMYGVLVLVGLHIGGVLRHEITTKEGIVSKMIHGDEIK
ncbi:MAG: cytochrome b/b6 domain-containing protein [Sulfurimonadaceae bacterium]